ncbi:hypothetical protein T4C_10038 [Trichinella pseudospiralis]|uniref:Uncharacterized protein n=1 Tax=Trichinella pseudospiralis TaxID=6337 RepID=A0A0V1GHZ9_TRIPS|nr:hypothetical protein T4C_10038 [Trichinella pseudospiralis]
MFLPFSSVIINRNATFEVLKIGATPNQLVS